MSDTVNMGKAAEASTDPYLPQAQLDQHDNVILEKTTTRLSTEAEFSFSQWLSDIEHQKSVDDIAKKHLSLTWDHLTVKGVDSRTVLGHDVLSCVNPIELIRDKRGNTGEITILHDLSGQVRPGELMLVLGRPGSGCTSFLKTIANKRASFKSVEGEVHYGNMTAKEAEHYRGLVLYNSEGEWCGVLVFVQFNC
jgi:ATPase subunit of ABC transporter with duplicated ATPase domains